MTLKQEIAKEIAKTIQEQLIATVGTIVIYSWGQYGLQFLTSDNLIELGIDNGIGAFKFKVNGKFHKGHVVVVLNGMDTYDLYICNIRKRKMTIINSFKGLFFDQIGTYIDQAVEMKIN